MDSVEEVQAWLDENHPGLTIRAMRNGGYMVEQKVYRNEIMYDEHGEPWFEYREEGRQEVFRIKNRLLGSWIADEIKRRDPSEAHRPGNAYHEAWKASLDAEAERHKDQEAYRSNALESWNIAKRNPDLMNRFARRLMAGDKYAWQEFSLENIARNAARYNGSELRSKDFWRSIQREVG